MKTNNIAYDSRKVKSGDLFVAIPGLKVDGHDFIAHAIKAGASTIVAEKDFDAPPSVKKVIVDNSFGGTFKQIL